MCSRTGSSRARGRSEGRETGEMALEQAELGEAGQWVPTEDMEMASGVPSPVSPGPGQEDAAVLGVTALLGAAAPGPR